MLERESRRERILEARNREIRLRQRTKMAESSHRDISDKETINKPSIILDSAVKNAEKDFFTVIEMVIKTCHSVFRSSQYSHTNTENFLSL
jgi:dynein intermediate chain 2